VAVEEAAADGCDGEEQGAEEHGAKGHGTSVATVLLPVKASEMD
jgi:hypothetical protein